MAGIFFGRRVERDFGPAILFLVLSENIKHYCSQQTSPTRRDQRLRASSRPGLFMSIWAARGPQPLAGAHGASLLATAALRKHRI